MPVGQNSGDSNALTEDSAVSAFERLISSDDEHPETESAETPTTEEVEGNDVADEVEQSGEVESGDDEQTEEQPPAPALRKVKVDGEEIEVTEDELLKGYSRTADYTRKTQKLSEEAKAVAARDAELRAERAQIADRLTRLDEALHNVTPAEPDWDQLREESPDEFASTWAAWQQHKERLTAVSQARQEAIAKVQADQVKQQEEYLESERHALVEAIPEWKDSSIATKERGELAGYAKELGFSDNDLANVYDHRVVVLLRKAMKFDRAQKAKPALREKIESIKAATPGPSSTTARNKPEAAKRRERLRNSGNVRDAAAVFETMLD